VASGAKIEEGNVMEPKIELVFTKSIEMFAESIPGEDYVNELPTRSY
jgi:hypothetical protein